MQGIHPATLVHRLADLTGQRDTTQLESALLAAAQDLLRPEWLALYRRNVIDGESIEFVCALRAGEPDHEPPAASYDVLVDMPGVTIIPMAGRNGELLGYLALRRVPLPGEDELRAASAIARIYDNTLCLLREAQHDRLTGLLNRHTFDTRLDRALELARRTSRRRNDGGKPVRFFLGEIDIDHFKSVNDRFGHLYGDEVLLIVARLIRANFRRGDLAFRFGGEEFVVIVVAETCEGAQLSFERLRSRIEEHVFPQVGCVTVSAGLTEIREADAPVQILGRADQALYHAKNNGRNQVCFYEALVDGGTLAPAQAAGEVTIFQDKDSTPPVLVPDRII
jgi:diguanylate cyclase (GGDEF)-like protein